MWFDFVTHDAVMLKLRKTLWGMRMANNYHLFNENDSRMDRTGEEARLETLLLVDR